MLDASKFEICALASSGARNASNSISLKVERELFIEQATLCLRSIGAAVVVMAFDEEGRRYGR
jgi:cobalamin-dependent methionine synthase I